MSGTKLSPAAQAATAYHEAGHAVAAVLRGVKLRHATTVSDGDTAGHVRYLRRPRSVDDMHRRGVVAMAGEAAQRRFNPRSVRRHHGEGDRRSVVDYALDCTGSGEQATLLVRLWGLQARDFVAVRWPSIQRVAAALLEKQTLDAAELVRLTYLPPVTFNGTPQPPVMGRSANAG